MLRYVIRRLLQMVVTFVGATFVVYALMFANQGDPVRALAGETQDAAVPVFTFTRTGSGW